MILSTYHSHTTFCDGKNTAEEMVNAAIELGCREIGISSHGYNEFDAEWSIKSLEEQENYKKEILRLKDKYKDKIKIYLGVEYDYFCDFPTNDYDYIIGAVHTVVKDGVRLSVDGGTLQEQKEQLQKYYGGDFLAYARDYYSLVADLYRKTRCDIIGHFDLLSKYNENGDFFSENDARYMEIANRACEELLKTPVTFELNTGAISRGYRTKPYPADFLIEKIRDAGRRVVINSDSHKKDTLLFCFDEAQVMLDKMGCGYYTSLDEIIANRK